MGGGGGGCGLDFGVGACVSSVAHELSTASGSTAPRRFSPPVGCPPRPRLRARASIAKTTMLIRHRSGVINGAF